MRAIRRRDLVGVLAWILTAEALLAAAAIGVAVVDGAPVGHRWLGLAVTATLAGLHWWRHRAPWRWLGGVGLVWIELSVVHAIAFEPDPASAGFLHVVLVWIGVLAFGFLPRRQAWAHTGATLAATATVWVLDGTPPVDVAIAAVLLGGTVVGVGLLLAMLVDQAQVHARTDVLTGIANRRGILAALDDEAERGAREDRPVALLLLDLDGFKEVNDALGHAAGDDLLRRTTAAWRSALRSRDRIGRLGGDEFLVLLPDAADRVTDRIASRLDRLTPAAVGVTIGRATLAPGEPVEDALGRCDADLYVRKAARGGPAPDAAAAADAVG